MLFRATAAIRAGQEVLDRYSTPLADHFEFTLHTLAAHGMRDVAYEATAAAWEGEAPKLSTEKMQLMATLIKASGLRRAQECLKSIERKVTWSNGHWF